MFVLILHVLFLGVPLLHTPLLGQVSASHPVIVIYAFIMSRSRYCV